MPIQPLLAHGSPADDALPPLPAAWECDLATNALRWSPGVYTLFGFPPGSRVTRDQAVAMYTPESAALLEQVRSKAVAEGTSFTIDVTIRRPDGELRKMRLTADVECEHGRPVRLYGTKQDVTDEEAYSTAQSVSSSAVMAALSAMPTTAKVPPSSET